VGDFSRMLGPFPKLGLASYIESGQIENARPLRISMRKPLRALWKIAENYDWCY